MVDLNIYENRVLLPRKPKFGSFLTLKHMFLYFVSKIDMISPLSTLNFRKTEF